MAILQTSAKLVTKRLPKVISPTAHAVIDYISAATFFAVGALYFRRNKRAAISAIVCGAAETVTSLLTDYPGGVADGRNTRDGANGLIECFPICLIRRRIGGDGGAENEAERATQRNRSQTAQTYKSSIPAARS